MLEEVIPGGTEQLAGRGPADSTCADTGRKGTDGALAGVVPHLRHPGLCLLLSPGIRVPIDMPSTPHGGHGLTTF